jgi:CheY-specific phosphatase CheX
MIISDEDLSQIAEEICLSIFEDPDAVGPDPAPAEPRVMTAIIDINGDWNGTVSVQCSKVTATRIASAMFDLPADDLSGADVIDALGEFTNMAAGAVKGMLDGDKKLGLPTVGEGVDYVMVVPHSREIAAIDYRVGPADLHISVQTIERD